MLLFLEYILCFIELLILSLFLSKVFQMRFSNLLSLVLILFFALIDLYISIYLKGLLSNILLLLVLYLYSLIAFKSVIYKNLFLTTLFYLFEGLVSLMTINIFAVIYNQDTDILMTGTNIRYLCGLANKVITSLPLILFRQKFSSFLDPKIDKRYNVVLFLSVFSLSICLLIGYDISLQNVEMYVKIVMLFLIIVLAISLLLVTILNFMHTKALVRLAEFEILNKNRMILDEWYSEVKNNQEEISKIKHDIKNILSSLKTLINYEDNVGAVKLIEEVVNAGDLNKTIRWTNNVLFDSIVYRKLYKNSNVFFKIKPGTLPSYLSNLDTSLLFSNLFDNSIEAAEKSKEKKIEVCLDYNAIGYTVHIVNSTNNESIDFNTTTKMDFSNHGYGMKVIRGIIEKYHAHIVYSINDGQVEIFIQFPSDFYD